MAGKKTIFGYETVPIRQCNEGMRFFIHELNKVASAISAVYVASSTPFRSVPIFLKK